MVFTTKKMAVEPAPRGAHELVFTVTANFTAEPLAESFHFWANRLALGPVDLEFSGYNQVFQDLLAPNSGLASNAPGLNVILIRLQEWGHDREEGLRAEAITTGTREFIKALRAFGPRAKRRTVLALCAESRSAAENPKLSQQLQSLEKEVEDSSAGLSNVIVIPAKEIAALYPVEVVDDPEANRQGHIPFTRDYWAALGTMLARRAHALLRPPYKVIAVDADNTLWGGVAAEVGAANVEVGGEWRLMQEFLRSCRKKGMLLTLVSKNAEADVDEVFRRPEMVLRREDFVSWKVNWEPKSLNVSSLARELELGLDSFIFLDDNPVECADVAANCPGITPLVLPSDTRQIPSFLKHSWVFDLPGTTAVDEQRSELYREQSQRNQFRTAAASFSEFINDLQLTVEVTPALSSQYERAAQLTQRTNQFNTSGIRRTSAELAALLSANERSALLVRARDRFGDYGEVGLAVFSASDSSMVVDSLLMSCRVLGKGVEHRLLAALGAEAQRLGVGNVLIPFKSTERNQPAEEFLRSVAGPPSDGSFRLSPAQAAAVTFHPETSAVLDQKISAVGAQKAAQSERVDFQAIANLDSVQAIVREVARQLRRPRPQLPHKLVRPRSLRESKLAVIWQEVLHLDQIGVTDPFLALGGHSLQAAGIASRIAAEFGVRVPLVFLLANPAIAELDQYIAAASPIESQPIRKAKQAALSPAQQRLWFLDQFIPNRAAYNIPLAWKIQGSLNLEAMETALAAICLRHDMLRSTYPASEESASIQISGSPQACLTRVRAASEADALRLASEEAQRVFDLSRGPLLRCLAITLGPQEHLLVLNVHHIASDGWSMGILVRDLVQAYEAATAGRQPAWTPLPVSYADYAGWQRQRLVAGDFVADLEYWRNELRDAPSLLKLPTDKPRPSAMTYVGRSVSRHIPSGVRHALDSFAEQERCTPFVVLLSIFQTLLHRYSQQEDVVVGTAVGGRADASFEEIIGCFVNTLALRTSVDSGASFRDHVRLVRGKVLDALAHQDLPFEHLVNELGLGRDLSRAALFQVMFVLQNAPPTDFAPAGLSTIPVPIHNGGAKFDLVLEVTPVADGYNLSLEFNTSLFLSETAERLLGHFAHLLEKACAAPETLLASLPMMDEVEEQRVLSFVSRENRSFDQADCLHRWFERQVALSPDAPALTYDGQTLSYDEVNRRANRIAHYLISCGIGPDVLVGICIDRSLDLVIGILAILKAGGAYLPIDLSYPADRLAFMLSDAQAPMLLTETKLLSSLTGHAARSICLDDAKDILCRQPDSNPATAVSPEHMAYVIYTSGSTGKPKGCMVTHRNVARLMRATEHWYRFNERDVWTLFHSSAFDFSVWEIWGALLYGGRLVVVPFLVSRSPESFYELLAREQVTVLNQTPSAFRQLIQVDESGASAELALRYIIFGGEALEMQSLRPWFDRHGDQQPLLVNMYGITETTVHVTYRPLSSSDVESGSVIGVPIPDLQIYILDSRKRPVPVGVPGEMYVGGAGLARGYLRRPELTAQRFVPDHLTGQKDARLYRTGDLARFLPGREVEYLGRVDDQVKIRGFRIELGEIESVLGQHPAIREVSVMARESVPGTKQLVAYLVSSGPRPGLSELREHLKKRLPEYMIPAAFVFLEALPLTNNGKIDRKALPAPEPERPEMARQYTAPRTAVEKQLASIWSKVLRVEKIGVHDNFFELGGDSILSIQVIALARRQGLKLTPTLLFENQTVGELSAVATLAVNAAAKQEVLTGDLPLTPIQHWFFEQNLEDPHHYNQAFLFEVSGRLDRKLLQTALQAVNHHHDALRLRFVRQNGTWRQFYSAIDPPVLLDVIEIENLSEESQREAIASAAASAQTGFNLQHGPIWRVVYFDRGQDDSGRLLILVHHLAVDGVSWRPLLEDIETAYSQLSRMLPVQLPAKTTSFGKWAESLQKFAVSDSLREELPYWRSCSDADRLANAAALPRTETQSFQNTEGRARTLVTSLPEEATLQLLQQVPAAYNTQINDALLTALAQAWRRSTGSRVFFTNLEGHGRENLFEDVDLSRTVGWFTSIFPVRIELPGVGENWRPADALKSVKEQLRKIPRRGVGYGLLRHLDKEQELHRLPEAPMVFNYLGQFDQVLHNSRIFRFASESSGPWHSPKQLRRYALEVNSLVVDGQLQTRWTYCPELNSERSVQSLADEFATALQELIEHCRTQRAGGRTTADFPLAQLGQASLDKLLAQYSDVEDIYPLSPMQTLFLSANPARMQTAFDQWQCTLSGELDVAAFERAWHETVNRHSILRSSVHSEGVREPLQIVKKRVDLPWTKEDWRHVLPDQIDERWSEFLKVDRAQPLDLSQSPVMRLALVRLARNRWKFLWSLPALLLDGWSWPLVFRDASRIYESAVRNAAPQLESVPPYRDYLRWLETYSFEGSKKFWSEMLSGFSEPTALPCETPDSSKKEERFASHRIALSREASEELQATARRLQLTVNSLVQGAWALVLSRQNQSADVVFGSAFSGRPTDLDGAESIVGPFVNTVPLRVAFNRQDTVSRFFQNVHSSLLRLNPHQFLPLTEIQRCTNVPERRRLFDSLVVFQNYQIEDAAKSFGGQVQILDFAGPIHTNYPLLLLIEPQAGLRLTLIYDTRILTPATVERWGRDIAALLENIPVALDRSAGDLQTILSAAVDTDARRLRQPARENQNFVPAQTPSELAIARVWGEMFELDRVSVDENFFDLGGHSLLLVKMHSRLQESLYPDLSVVTLFEHPTVRSLAQHLDQAGNTETGTTAGESQNRAKQQKQALQQLRARLKKSSS